MNSTIKKITGLFLLFIFFLSIFLCIAVPFEIRNVIKSNSWEPRDMEILSSNIVRVGRTGPKHGYSHHIEINAKDLANDKRITISNVRYGDLPFTIHAFGKIIVSNHESDVKKYPAGAKVVGYKDPNSEKYVLERGNIVAPIAVLSLAALWLLGNVFIMIRYPKNRKKENDSFLLNS